MQTDVRSENVGRVPDPLSVTYADCREKRGGGGEEGFFLSSFRRRHGKKPVSPLSTPFTLSVVIHILADGWLEKD